MSQQAQPLVYHSLSRHVQSIPMEQQHLRVFNIYSSNQQPPVPSILDRSRSKKSHEKSLKKGLSRVTKSKKHIHIGLGSSNELHEKSLSKGTLLNFNIQQVVDTKYHAIKPRDEVLQISPKKDQMRSLNQIEASQPVSNQKSFISEYRIVTYVPSGRVHDDRRQSFVGEEKQAMRQESRVGENWDKENNSNHSNVFKEKHQKNDSESIQVINPTDENRLEQNTWRTEDNFDPYYSNNFGSQINQSNENLITQRQNLHSSLKQKYSVPVSNQINELRNAMVEIGPLKDKIKHLEHEIVQIEREKSLLIKNNSQLEMFRKENYTLKDENDTLFMQNKTLVEQNALLKEENQSNLSKIKRLNEHVLKLEQRIAELSNHANPPKERVFSESYLFQQTQKKTQQKFKSIEQSLRKQLESLESTNSALSLAKAKLQKELSQKVLTLTELSRKHKDLTQKIAELEKDVRKEKEKIQSQEEKLYRKDEKINSLSLELDRLNLIIKDLKQKVSKAQQSQKPSSSIEQKPSSIEPSQFQSLSMDRSREERVQNLLQDQLQATRHKYEQLSRDYAHLEKKQTFMKDELQHLKYLQVNGSSSALSHRSNSQNKYNSLGANGNKTQTNFQSNKLRQKQFQQEIYELQTRLEISDRNLGQVQEEYSNLKQNFRALEELYMKQQDENEELKQEMLRVGQENNRLKIELSSMEQISKAKAIAFSENESLKLMEKEEELLRLKRQFSSLERICDQLQRKCSEAERNQTQMQRAYVEMQRAYVEMQRTCIQMQRKYHEMQKKQSEMQKKQSEMQRKYSQMQRTYIQMQKKHIETQRNYAESERRNCQTQRKQLQSSAQFAMLQGQLNTVKTQRDQLYSKYLNELSNNTQQSQRHKEDLQIYLAKMEKQQQQKILIITQKYQALIARLNSQIANLNTSIATTNQLHAKQLQDRQAKFTRELAIAQQTHLDELTRNQHEHQQEVQTLLAELDRQQLTYQSSLQKVIAKNAQSLKCKEQNAMESSHNHLPGNKYQTASKINRFLTYETMSRKELESFTTELQSDFTLIQNKYKTLVIQKQRLEDHAESTARQMSHLEQQLRLYKQHKQNSLKEKYELRQQVQRSNMLMLQMKKSVTLFDQQKMSFTSRINELNQKYLSTVQDYEKLIQELKQVKTLLYDREIKLQNYQHDLRELRIAILEEKEIAQKKAREINVLKEEREAVKSKEEYYKMLFEKTQTELERQLQQKALLLSTHAPKVPNSSPIKHNSPEKKLNKNSSPEKKLHQNLVQKQQKVRQTELYRIEILKDVNKVLKLTNEHYSLEQILQKNEQEYLRRVYNAIKQQEQKKLQLKKLIVEMQQGFTKEKAFIKQDYDVLYEKYLKYKSMCQDMNRDIQRYKLRLKMDKEQDFIHVNL